MLRIWDYWSCGSALEYGTSSSTESLDVSLVISVDGSNRSVDISQYQPVHSVHFKPFVIIRLYRDEHYCWMKLIS
jgi:hypothetical protein